MEDSTLVGRDRAASMEDPTRILTKDRSPPTLVPALCVSLVTVVIHSPTSTASERLGTWLVRASAQVAVAVVVHTHALFAHVPQQFDSPIHQHRSVGDEDAMWGYRPPNGDRHSLWGCVAEPIRLTLLNNLGQCFIRLLDKLDRAGPLLCGLLQSAEQRRVKFGRFAECYAAAGDTGRADASQNLEGSIFGRDPNCALH